MLIIINFAKRVFNFDYSKTMISLKNNALALVVFAGTAFGASAQCDSKLTAEADKQFKQGFYYRAIEFYDKALGKAKDKSEKACMNFMIGKCYSFMEDHKKAISYYDKADKGGYSGAELHMYRALSKKEQGNYEDAKLDFEEFLKENPENAEAKAGLESIELAIKWKNNPTCYTVENLKALNTKENDFAPIYASKKGDQVIFTSKREESLGREDLITGQVPEDLYTINYDLKKKKWGKPTPLGDPINTKSSEGASAINKRFNTIYFTRCGAEKKAKVGCQIFEAKKQGKGWAEPTLIPLADDSFATCHPAISADGNYLVFSSNMPGGQGAMDLWVAKYDRRARTFTNPVNLGPEINTPDNEMYPYLRSDDRLYFSSDRLSGMGGLDIYKANLVEPGKWNNVENMRYPINSEGDDFGIVFDGVNEKGLLTSSRAGGRGKDDIYTFEIAKSNISLVTTVIDVDTKQPVAGAVITYKNSAGETKEFTTDASGKATLAQGNFNESYDIVARKDKYFGNNGNISTKEIDPLTTCKDTVLYLELAIKNADVPLSFDILFVFARAEYYEEYQDTVDKIFKILHDNPTMTAELIAHTDNRGSEAANQKLSEDRANYVFKNLISKGIDPKRLKALGKGESVPRTLMEDIGNFKKGTVLTEEFINGLTDKDDIELAHKLNRRVELRKVDDSFVPPAPPKPAEDKDEE